jgi:hypothetical protein
MTLMDTSLEERLAHLEEYDNLEQLALLYEELSVIGRPDEAWYESRYRIVDTYSRLNFSAIARRFEHRDAYLAETAQRIFAFAAEIVDQWSTSPLFDLRVYMALIEELYQMMTYYHLNYDQAMEEVDDLADQIMEL